MVSRSLVLVVLVGVVAQGAEWFTSRGNFCTNRCTAADKDGRQTYTCHAVDGVQKERRGASEGLPHLSPYLPTKPNYV